MHVKKVNVWLCILLGCLISIISYSPLSVQAETVRSVETDGTIGFYGEYIPIGEPNPEPPGGTNNPSERPISPGSPSTGQLGQGQKPTGGMFPQTGELIQSYSLWLGVILVCIALYRLERRRYNRL